MNLKKIERENTNVMLNLVQHLKIKEDPESSPEYNEKINKI